MFGLVGIGRTLIARQRTQHHVETTTHEPRSSVGLTVRGQLFNERLHNLEAVFLVRHFTPAKTQGGFHLHVLTDEIDRARDFGAEVMRIDGGPQLHFFDLVGVLMFL